MSFSHAQDIPRPALWALGYVFAVIVSFLISVPSIYEPARPDVQPMLMPDAIRGQWIAAAIVALLVGPWALRKTRAAGKRFGWFALGFLVMEIAVVLLMRPVDSLREAAYYLLIPLSILPMICVSVFVYTMIAPADGDETRHGN